MSNNLATPLTEKEHTYLALKWGVNYLLDLYFVLNAGATGMSELEQRAARLGRKICQERDYETARLLGGQSK